MKPTMPRGVDFGIRLYCRLCQSLALIPWGRQTNILNINFQKMGIIILPSVDCCDAARAAITKHCKLGGLDNRNLLSHSSGSWRSKIKVLASLLFF